MRAAQRGKELNPPGRLNSRIKETPLVSHIRVRFSHVISWPSSRASTDPSSFCTHRAPQRQTRVPTYQPKFWEYYDLNIILELSALLRVPCPSHWRIQFGKALQSCRANQSKGVGTGTQLHTTLLILSTLSLTSRSPPRSSLNRSTSAKCNAWLRYLSKSRRK